MPQPVSSSREVVAAAGMLERHYSSSRVQGPEDKTLPHKRTDRSTTSSAAFGGKKSKRAHIESEVEQKEALSPNKDGEPDGDDEVKDEVNRAPTA